METGNQDGMDVSLCRLQKLDTGMTQLVFAGAKQTLYVHDNQKINELKGTRKSIGGYYEELSNSTKFENSELLLSPEATIYLTSDGLIDSPNPQRRKFGRKRFRSFIEENSYLPLSTQKQFLVNTLEKFQQDTIQRDDILVMGVKA